MKLDNMGSPTTHAPFSKQIGFSMDNSTKGFRLLTKDLYVDKPAALARETISNAMDAVRSNPKERPPKITVKFVDGTFIVEDNGCGMSVDELATVYTVLFKSPKDQENSDLGAYGLGAKIPLSYGTERMTITTVKNGKRVQAVAFTDNDPQLGIISESETDQSPGTRIEVPLGDKVSTMISTALELAVINPDIIQVSDAFGNILERHGIESTRHCDGDMVFVSVKLGPNNGALSNKKVHVVPYIDTTASIGVKISPRFPTRKPSPVTGSLLIDGRIPYNVGVEKENELLRDLLQSSYMMSIHHSEYDKHVWATRAVPIGQVKMNLSREKLIFDENVSENFAEEFGARSEEIRTIHNSEVARLFHRWMAGETIAVDQIDSIQSLARLTLATVLNKETTNAATGYAFPTFRGDYLETVDDRPGLTFKAVKDYTTRSTGNEFGEQYRISFGRIRVIEGRVTDRATTQDRTYLNYPLNEVVDSGLYPVVVIDRESRKNIPITDYLHRKKFSSYVKIDPFKTSVTSKASRMADIDAALPYIKAIGKRLNWNIVESTDFPEKDTGTMQRQKPENVPKTFKLTYAHHWKFNPVKDEPNVNTDDVVIFCNSQKSRISGEFKGHGVTFSEATGTGRAGWRRNRLSTLIAMHEAAVDIGALHPNSRILVRSVKDLESDPGFLSVKDMMVKVMETVTRRFPRTVDDCDAWALLDQSSGMITDTTVRPAGHILRDFPQIEQIAHALSLVNRVMNDSTNKWAARMTNSSRDSAGSIEKKLWNVRARKTANISYTKLSDDFLNNLVLDCVGTPAAANQYFENLKKEVYDIMREEIARKLGGLGNVQPK